MTGFSLNFISPLYSNPN